MTGGRRDAEGGAALGLSVVVLNFNRKDLVRRVLRSLERQEPAPGEIIAVDNGSQDGSAAVIREEFPRVKLIALQENQGIRGRNIGFAAAKGAVILSLDNDIELIDPGSLRRMVERFDADPRVAALSLKICEPETGSDYTPTHWWHPLPRERFQDREFVTDHFNEAAVAFRSDVLGQAGYYYEELYWGGEEWDLALGIMNLGYEIRYFPEPVLHLAPRGNLNEQADPRNALLIRNRCWIALRRLPPLAAARFVLPRLALWFIRSLRYGYAHHYLRGTLDLVRNYRRIRLSRMRISAQTYARLKQIRQQR